MSNYPPGAFESLVNRDEREEESALKFEQLKAARMQELLSGGEVEFTTYRRPRHEMARSLIFSHIDDDLLHEAMQKWLLGDFKTCFEKFNESLKVGLDQASEFLANCDLEGGL